MARPLTLLVVFFVALNVFAGMLMATGVDAVLGLDTSVGGDEAVNQRVGNSNVDTGTSTGNTLFGMYNVLGGQLASFFGVIFPGLNMLNRAGVPAFITGGVLGPLFSIAIFVDIVSFFRGWGL